MGLGYGFNRSVFYQGKQNKIAKTRRTTFVDTNEFCYWVSLPSVSMTHLIFPISF